MGDVALDRDERTEAVVMIGEIGGAMEEEAAEYAAGMKKPMRLPGGLVAAVGKFLSNCYCTMN